MEILGVKCITMNGTPKLSKLKTYTIEAFKKGYRISPCGMLFGPNGNKMSKYFHLKGANRYARFSFKKNKVYWHHLVAYQKFKDKWIYSGLLVRHLNGNSEDNSFSNISLGTKQDNSMDIPRHLRNVNTRNANLSRRRFSDSEIIEIKELLNYTTGYKIAKMFKCSAKTIYDIKKGETYKN